MASGDPVAGTDATDEPDAFLAYHVADAIISDGRTRHQRVTVRVHNRVVLLSGTVDRQELKQAVGDIARDVAGVIDVCNALRVTGGEGRSGPGTDDEFDRIVAELRAEGPPGTRRSPRPSGSVALWAALGAGAWALLTLLMVTAQWTAVALVCLTVGLVLTVAAGRRRKRRYDSM